MLNKTYIPSKKKKKKGERRGKKKCYVTHVGLLGKVTGKKKTMKPLETGKSGEKGVHLKSIYFSAVTCRLQGWENPAWCIQEAVAQATREVNVIHQEYQEAMQNKLFSVKWYFPFSRDTMIEKENLLLIRIHEGNYSALT